MPNRLLPSKHRLIDVMLMRVGEAVDIYRDDGTAVENQFGKIDDNDITRTLVGSTRSRRIYETNRERQSRDITTGGRRISDEPRGLFMATDAPVQEGDHVEFPDGQRYHLLNKVPYSSHDEWRVERVS